MLPVVLAVAVRDRLLASNPAADVKRPTVEHHEARFLEAAEVRRLLAAVEGERYADTLRLIALTGIRRGEALGLRWQDVDAERGVLRVRQTLGRVSEGAGQVGHLVVTAPKSARSRREIDLTATMTKLLSRHRAEQAAERLRAGSAWEDSGLVFTTATGTAVDPRNLARTFSRVAKRAEVEGASLHSLRYSAALAMLDAGMRLVTVSRILGHASIAVTADLYGHVSEAGRRSAVEAIGAAYGL